MLYLVYLQVSEADVLPKFICSHCYKTINEFHAFYYNAHKSQQNFIRKLVKIEIDDGKCIAFTSYKPREVNYDGHANALGKLFSDPCGSNIRKQTITENVSPMSEDSNLDELTETPMIKVENIEIGEDDEGWTPRTFPLFEISRRHFCKRNE